MAGHARLAGIVGAGVVDSLCLSVAWTVLLLHVTREHGLAAAGACGAALLVGVALSAPVAGWASSRLGGRALLRAAAGLEAGARVGAFVALLAGAPLWVVALCVAGMSVTGWTGYAGMRAEVTAATSLPAALTWYGTVVAAVEAAGVALASLLPATGGPDGGGPVLLVVMVVAAAGLLPTVAVARGSRVPRGVPARGPGRRRLRVPRPDVPTVMGAVLMAAASAPTLLAVALAAQLHGRAAVGPAAAAFIAGSLLAPAVAALVQRRDANRLPVWALCATVMVAGWVMAPSGVAWLCAAQVASGLGMTTLEGLLDTAAARRRPGAVTGALARATAVRALGSAAGTAMLPVAVVSQGLPVVAGTTAAALAAAVLVTGYAGAVRSRRRTPETVRRVVSGAGPAAAVHPAAAG